MRKIVDHCGIPQRFGIPGGLYNWNFLGVAYLKTMEKFKTILIAEQFLVNYFGGLAIEIVFDEFDEENIAMISLVYSI